MNKVYFLFFIIVAILVEATITPIPIVALVLLVFYIVKRSSQVFFPAFVSGIVLDIFSVRTLGLSSLFFIAFMFTVFLYERKFETQTITFVFFATFLGSLIYLKIFGYNNILFQSFINAIIGVLLFKFSISNLK